MMQRVKCKYANGQAKATRQIRMNEQTTIHGVFLDIHNAGVLLIGPSNIGKSELALTLIERGHRLIADDYIILEKNHNALIGICPPPLKGFLALRDLGIINVIKLFGRHAIHTQKPVELIIKLAPFHEQQTDSYQTHLEGSLTMQTLMNINIPQYTLLVKPNRNLASLVEISVGSYQLKKQGYDAHADFAAKQQSLIDSSL